MNMHTTILKTLLLPGLLLATSAMLLAQRHDLIRQIPDLRTYTALAGEPVAEKYGQVSSLKVVMALRDSAVYFISSQEFKYHYDFCRARLGYWKEHATFNAENYAQHSRRDYCLANINRYHASNTWTLELSSADDFPPRLIQPFHRKVSAALFSGDSLRLLLNTLLLEEKVRAMPRPPCPVLHVNTLYGGLRYQCLGTGSAYGYLRFYTPALLDSIPPGPRDIVVLDGEALDIPPVSGLLCSTFQTPLSHLVLLCRNRRTPFIAQRGVARVAALRRLEGKLIRFEATSDTFSVRPATLAEAQPAWEAQRPNPISLRCDTSRAALIPADRLRLKMVDLVGGKAANFGELALIARAARGAWKVPEGGFAIPFAHYTRHMKASGAANLLESLLQSPEDLADAASLRECLADIRSAIRKHPVDRALLSAIDSITHASSPTTRMRFRSSTNAEDIEGFNGAGLYESRTGTVGDTSGSVEKAIQRVWASLWSFEAFQERAYFGIDHRSIAMGLLVHRSFPDELANGVAITANLYRPGYYGFVINAQVGETSVVSPPPGVIAEQLICYQDSELDFFKQKRIIEYITHSNQTENGAPVLSEAQVIHLTLALADLKEYYYWRAPKAKQTPFNEYALDVEFKFDRPDGQLYLKQVRPFKP